ncbi:GNAT family N-acetyltransferase [Macrococcus sp. DPC7161]|nr:GNAT family N-acetyltransferase [Macrococcus sp. DPC7161]
MSFFYYIYRFLKMKCTEDLCILNERDILGEIMIEIRYATIEDLSRVCKIQDRAHEVLTYHEWLVFVEPTELKRAIMNQHMAVALVEGQIAGFRTLEISETDYLGKYNNLANHEDMIYSDLSVVDPDYRGMGIQKLMGEWLFERIEQRYVFATVHPDNIASLKDKFHLGMYIIAFDEVYPGKKRFVFFKDMQQERIAKGAATVMVPLTFDDSFAKLIDDGYVGIAIDEDALIFSL